jgi:hypothetical protein
MRPLERKRGAEWGEIARGAHCFPRTGSSVRTSTYTFSIKDMCCSFPEVDEVPAYENYGISVELVERIKRKMKEPSAKERVKTVLTNVSKADLQNRGKVKKLLDLATKALGEKLSEEQADHIVRFVVAQKIDPNNALHLIKLWHMFR